MFILERLETAIKFLSEYIYEFLTLSVITSPFIKLLFLSLLPVSHNAL